MTSPCVPECEQRSAECRLHCPAFKKYYAAKQEEYKQREIERIVNSAAFENALKVKKWAGKTVWQH